MMILLFIFVLINVKLTLLRSARYLVNGRHFVTIGI